MCVGCLVVFVGRVDCYQFVRSVLLLLLSCHDWLLVVLILLAGSIATRLFGWLLDLLAGSIATRLIGWLVGWLIWWQGLLIPGWQGRLLPC